MKNLILFTVFFTQYSLGNGQSINSPVVSATTFNILYKGIDNPVKLAVPRLGCEEIFVKISNGKITGENCNYKIKPGDDNLTKLFIYTVTGKKDTIDIGVYNFRVKSIPNPRPVFFGLKNNFQHVQKNKVASAMGVMVELEDFDFDVRFKLISYDLMIVKSNGEYELFHSDDAYLTDEMKNAIKNTEIKDVLNFTNIKAKCFQDETIRNLEELKLIIQ